MPRAGSGGYRRRGDAGKAGQHHDAHLRGCARAEAHGGQAVGFALEPEVCSRAYGGVCTAALPCRRCPRRAALVTACSRTRRASGGKAAHRLPMISSRRSGECVHGLPLSRCGSRVMAASESVMVTSAPFGAVACHHAAAQGAPRSSTGTAGAAPAALWWTEQGVPMWQVRQPKAGTVGDHDSQRIGIALRLQAHPAGIRIPGKETPD